MISFGDICYILVSIFRDFGWKSPSQDDFHHLSYVVKDFKNLPDRYDYIDLGEQELQKNLCKECLNKNWIRCHRQNDDKRCC